MQHVLQGHQLNQCTSRRLVSLDTQDAPLNHRSPGTASKLETPLAYLPSLSKSCSKDGMRVLFRYQTLPATFQTDRAEILFRSSFCRSVVGSTQALIAARCCYQLTSTLLDNLEYIFPGGRERCIMDVDINLIDEHNPTRAVVRARIRKSRLLIPSPGGRQVRCALSPRYVHTLQTGKNTQPPSNRSDVALSAAKSRLLDLHLS